MKNIIRLCVTVLLFIFSVEVSFGIDSNSIDSVSVDVVINQITTEDQNLSDNIAAPNDNLDGEALIVFVMLYILPVIMIAVVVLELVKVRRNRNRNDPKKAN